MSNSKNGRIIIVTFVALIIAIIVIIIVATIIIIESRVRDPNSTRLR